MKIFNKNIYYIMRHGESEANKSHLIISDPKNGLNNYGLTSEGIEQIKKNISEFKEAKIDLIYSSDFLRAKETAQKAAEILQIDDINYSPLLRERFFGDYEKMDDSNYNKIWEIDLEIPDVYPQNIESPVEVSFRLKNLFIKLESLYTDKIILLVSHGDTLQILQTIFLGLDAHSHRERAHLEKGELRKL